MILLYISEAFHDYHVIQDSKGDPIENPAWHKADSIFHTILWLLVCYITYNWWYILLCPIIRITFFQNTLNLLRKKGFFYLSDHGTDATITKYLGKYGAQIVFFISILGILAINYINFKK